MRPIVSRSFTKRIARSEGKSMTRSVRRGLVAAILVIACAGSASPATAAKRRVTVTRDSAGIPHVVAKDFRSLGYGEGFAYAQDNLCIFADQVMTLRGQRSQHFGPNSPAYQYVGGFNDPNIKSDFFWQRVRDSGVVDRIAKLKPPEGPTADARALYRGWAEGYNAFLRSGKLRDPACRNKPWVKPISERDLSLRLFQIATIASSGRFISGMVDAQSPGTAAPGADTPAKPSVDRLNERLGGAAEPTLGSNAVGLGSQGTQGRTGMVLANPHRAWRGTERFWMAHLTVPGSYDVMGGTIGGFPPIGIGFNKDIAWSHTLSTARRFVVFQLKLVPGDPTSYLVDGKPQKMETQTVAVGNRKHTFYKTRSGLVFNLPEAGFAWTNEVAYALADVEDENLRGVNQYLEMGRARSVEGLLKSLDRVLGIPTFNTIAADRSGRTLYADVGAIPNAPKAKIAACTPEGTARLVYAAARIVTLDGSRSDCALGRDTGAVAPGIFGPSSLPSLVRRDYVENSNDSYWLANPSKPLTGFSPIIGLENSAQGFRTRHGNALVRALLGKFTIRRLQRMLEGDGNYAAELTSKPLAAACSASPQVTLDDGSTVDIGEACPVLAAYGQTGDLDDKGAWLFDQWQRRAPPTGGGLFSDPFDPARPLTTPSVVNTSNPDVLQALGAAVKSMRAENVPLNATPRQAQFATRGKRRIPIHGCNFCFQAITAANDPAAQNATYGEVISGSSLVMTTELTKSGPRSQGILTYSQATDPTSPWFANMTELFSSKRWVPMRFTRRELAADRGARRTNVPGAER